MKKALTLWLTLALVLSILPATAQAAEGQDVAVYDQIAAGIARHFAEGTEMTFSNLKVEVTDTPHVQEGYEDGGYWNVPVSIPWRCYA